MNKPAPSTFSLPRSIRDGLLIFMLTFLSAYLITALIDVSLNSGQPMMGSHSVFIGHWTYLQAIACGLGIFFLSMRSRKPLPLAAGLSATVGLALFYRAEMFVPLFARPDTIQATLLRALATFLPEIIKGVIAGTALAWAFGLLKSWPRFALSGGLAFSIAWLVVSLLGSNVVAQIQALGGTTVVTIGSLWYFSYEVGLMAIYGMVLGAFFGGASVDSQHQPRQLAAI